MMQQQFIAAPKLPGYPCAWSPCKRYRYTLWRVWGDESNAVQFIGLNPSTADETQDDPTIRRCIGYAKAWGYGALCMTNLFGFRATDPRQMKSQANPIGDQNANCIADAIRHCQLAVCAWGNHGAHLNQSAVLRKWLALIGYADKLRYLRLSKTGEPCHPLYLPGDLQPLKFESV